MARCMLFLTVLLAAPAFAQLANPPQDATLAPALEAVPATEAAPATQAEAEAPPAPESAPAPTPAPAPETAAAAAPAPTPEMTPEQRLTQFRHDQINLLALRGDAGSLLAASLMASPDGDNKARPTPLQSPALLKRAQTAGEQDALVWWATAAFDCHASGKNCPHAETLQKLESIDPENAAVWTLSLWRAQQAKDAPAARAALASAAQAKNYNDHFGDFINTIYQAEAILPISEEILNATGQNESADGYRLISAAGIASGVGLPGYIAIGDACKLADSGDAALVADCLAVAKKMELSGSINSQKAGLSLMMAMLPPGSERDAVRARQRTLSWQTLRISDLGDRLVAQSSLTRTYIQALAESGDESAGVLAVLRSQGVALEPPPDWQPPQTGAALTP